MLSDQDFLRYQRQISLPEIGECGQEKITKSHVLIIGCGGLGSAGESIFSCCWSRPNGAGRR